MLFLCSQHADAAFVTLNGSNVTFTYDNSNLGLFGAPSVVGDSLYFTPTTFIAKSTNGQGEVLTSSTINIQIATKSSGLSFGQISLSEWGDYRLTNTGSSVDVDGALIVTNLANPLAFPVFTPITSPYDFGIVDSNVHFWQATATDLSQNGWSYINVTIQNILTASTTQNPSSAFIEKKFVGLGVSTVPIPGAAWMLGAGLIGLVAVRRRNKKQAELI